MEKQKKNYQLTPQTVDVLSQVCEEVLESAKVDRKDIIRLRLSLEEILEGWLKNLSGAEVVCEIGQRFGKQKIEFRVKGEEVAFEAEKDTLLFNMLLGMLRSISSPMIFLAVCWGIINIGDVGTVERIGGRILLRMLIGTFVAGIVSVLLLLFFFPMGKEATASSAAAFGENIDTCQNKLGLSKQISNFAVPLGQVVFMPAGVVAFLGVSFTMAQIYGVIITPVWILTAVLVSALLAMAISIDMLLDFVITATNLACLQTELTLAAGKLGVINTAILKRVSK